jgi:glutaredoxin
MLRTWIAALLLAQAMAAAAQYKWTDANGRVNYGDNPPRNAQNIERIDRRPAAADDPLQGLPFELRRAASTYPVTLYTGKDCSPCDAARNLLLARGVPYSERTVTSREDIDQFQRLGYGSAVPVVVIGTLTQRQFQPDEWHKLLDAAGYPRTSQLPPGWKLPPPEPLVAPPPPQPAAEAEAAEAPPVTSTRRGPPIGN